MVKIKDVKRYVEEVDKISLERTARKQRKRMMRWGEMESERVE